MDGKISVSVVLICLNVLAFLGVEITGGSQDLQNMLSWGAGYAPLVEQGHEYYRLFTCMFLHFGMEHLVNNMLALYFVGGHLERAVGKINFLLIYLAGGVGASCLSYYRDIQQGSAHISAGASGAVFAVIGAMIYVLLLNRGRLQGLTVRQMVFMAVLSLYYGFTTTGVDNTAHIGGIFCGFLLAVIFYRRKVIRTEKIK
ncbi:MAG: rhomboid family intramembrane serine protease [Lachnospiraceae bacterium]|nr:rhomboid family intramembrane serine protease [Lachnospiraceae bacterium]